MARLQADEPTLRRYHPCECTGPHCDRAPEEDLLGYTWLRCPWPLLRDHAWTALATLRAVQEIAPLRESEISAGYLEGLAVLARRDRARQTEARR